MSLGPLADHLWQSTLCAAGAALLALALRKRPAAARHWIWFAASLKFLLPIAALSAFGRMFAWRSRPLVDADVTQVIEAVSQPFSTATTTAATAAAGPLVPMTGILALIWLGGCSTVLTLWFMRWRRARLAVRCGRAVDDGREHLALRRVMNRVEVCRRVGVLSSRPVRLVVSAASTEPYVFGIVAPVLIWPGSLGARLDNEQLEAVMAHELCHVRRRDNLSSALHTIVTALFWFHPLVWWLGARLVAERERACDEAAVRAAHPRVYAESILETCRFSLESPPVCVAGVSGGDLEKRIAQIMNDEPRRPLTRSLRLLLTSAGVAALVLPVAAGALTPSVASPIAIAGSDRPSFATATVALSVDGHDRMQLRLERGGRFTASNLPLRSLIRLAYQVQDAQIAGGPDWIDSARFDIAAVGGADAPGGAGMFSASTRSMMQSLLAVRFGLELHVETRDLARLDLVVARRDGAPGPGLRPSSIDCAALADTPATAPRLLLSDNLQPCMFQIMPAKLIAGSATMAQLATALSRLTRQVVIDRTGLDGAFAFDLDFGPGGREDAISAALEAELGLRLEPRLEPMDVLVIDRVERPATTGGVGASPSNHHQNDAPEPARITGPVS